MSMRGEALLNSFYMDIAVFLTGTVPYINRKLKHGKPVVQKFFPELNIVFLFPLSFGREVKKY